MLKKTVLYFDQNAARQLALELAFKGQEEISFYAYKDFAEESYRINDFSPHLIIADQNYNIDKAYECLILGIDIQMPFSPIDLRNRILEILKN